MGAAQAWVLRDGRLTLREFWAPQYRYDWQRWTASVKLPSDGYFEIWTRGTDSKGEMQPHQAGFWNPQGYGGNPLHRIAVLVG